MKHQNNDTSNEPADPHKIQYNKKEISNHVQLLHYLMQGIDGKFVVMAINEDPHTGYKGRPVLRQFAVGNASDMTTFIISFEQQRHANVYCAWAVFRSDLDHNSKGAEDDVLAVRALVIDMDGDTGKSGRAPLNPSYVIETSPNNFQAAFIFGAFLMPQNAKQLAERYVACTLCDHGTKDIAHVWRVPGTLNWPTKSKLKRGRSPQPFLVRVDYPFDGTFADFAALWNVTEPTHQPSGNRAEASAGAAAGNDQDPFGILLNKCTEFWRAQLVQTGEPDRSKHLYSLIGFLKRDGFSKAEIFTLIWGHPTGAGHKPHEQGEKWFRDEIDRCWQKTDDPVEEVPRPLRRELPPPAAFPVEALGDTLTPATQAIVDKVQCPPAIAALSVLGVASLAVQAHADVVIPATGHAKPLALFLISVAASGERKSAADNEALRPVRQREAELLDWYTSAHRDYLNRLTAWQSARDKAKKDAKGNFGGTLDALTKLGPEPEQPLTPMLTCPEPTFEGLCRLFVNGFPALGIFSDEGGQFVGGHGLNPDNKLRTVTGLSGLWDGSPIKRVRVGDGASVLPGRRLAMHLMVQPAIALGLLSDPLLKDQGFLSRLLVSWPASTAGTRFQKTTAPESDMALQAYTSRIADVLRLQPPIAPGQTNELAPRQLTMDPTAAELWAQYADYVENRLAPGQPYEPIRGFANKLPEHAARIAGVLTLVENIDATSVQRDVLNRAIKIAEYFAAEALRLFDAGAASPEIRRAELLLDWLKTTWTERFIALRVIYQYGPNSIREAATAKPAIALLEEHGWLKKAPGNTLVAGQRVREAWEVVRVEQPK